MTLHANDTRDAGPEGLIFLPGFESDPIIVGENPDRQLSCIKAAIMMGRGAYRGLTLEHQEACFTALREQSALYLGERALVTTSEL